MADYERTVHTRVPKTTDIEIHVSTLTTNSGVFTDIREYVTSLDQYGRGITFPARSTVEIRDGMNAAADFEVLGG